ncbi:hypothetical protein P7C71_g518, partial [Lecanoromycetidae sp. Uapishka_2]
MSDYASPVSSPPFQYTLSSGLQPAKKALLAAYEGSANGLTVPEHVLKIERQLADEYKIKNEVAEKECRKKWKIEEDIAEEKRKKRKRDEEALLAEVLEDDEINERCAKKTKKNVPPKVLDIVKVQGEYSIAAPVLSEGWDCGGPLSLTLGLSSTESHLWGCFSFGVFEGILRSCSSTEPDDGTIEFLWRGRETGEGETTYGEENVAEFKFLGNGKFKGSMYWDCLGDFDLVGKLDEAASRNLDFVGSVEMWKDEYWSINDASYERARVSRWGDGGGWKYGGGESEEESNSDTGNERGANEVDEDEEDDDESEDEETRDILE